MKNLIHTAVITLFAASAAHAQQAVQWRVEDGGNGHWYSVDVTLRTWTSAESSATSRGAHLACFTSIAEQTAAFQVTNFSQQQSIWIGLIQAAGAQEPAGGWAWVTGEPISFSGWTFNSPNNDQGENVGEWTPSWGGGWNDMPDSGPRPALLEWSADCNNDGIVDYGQILQGQLGDTNADGIPDICQQPTCVDADLFRDFNVNGADLGILLSQWGPNTARTVSDINKDGFVNGADLGILLSFWGACPN